MKEIVMTQLLSAHNFKVLDSAVTQSFSSKDLVRRTIRRRAIEGAIWGMPLVNFDSLRQAYFRDAGAKYGDVVYWSRPADWKHQVTTPNASTNYAMFFVNLKDGPVVVEVPQSDDVAFLGTFIDCWNSPLFDVGSDGKGGKFVLLPPGESSAESADRVSVPSTTYNVYGVLRVIPKTGSVEDMTRATSFLKKLRIHPLSAATAPQANRFVDMAEKRYEAIPAYDASFFASLARMVAEEPVKERDLAIMGQLRSIGIGKGLVFEPSDLHTAIFHRAITEAHALLLEGFTKQGIVWWPQRRWRLLVTEDVIESKATFLANDRVMLDERAHLFFGAFGACRNPTPNLYVKTFEDKDRAPLDGWNTYRLRVPASVPTRQFWSVVAYDSQTAGFIREAPVVGLDSYNRNLKKNPDGAVDLYFAPKAPHGQETNWISTAAGRPFFVMFRNYAPDESVLNKTSTWVLSDLERVK
jgi:hypothetical protein